MLTAPPLSDQSWKSAPRTHAPEHQQPEIKSAPMPGSALMRYRAEIFLPGSIIIYILCAVNGQYTIYGILRNIFPILCGSDDLQPVPTEYFLPVRTEFSLRPPFSRRFTAFCGTESLRAHRLYKFCSTIFACTLDVPFRQ